MPHPPLPSVGCRWQRRRAPRLTLATALGALLWLVPQLASAEERDPGEIVHAMILLGILALLFLTGLSVAVWLLIARLRDRSPALPPPPAIEPDLDRLWFPAKVKAPARPPTA